MKKIFFIFLFFAFTTTTFAQFNYHGNAIRVYKGEFPMGFAAESFVLTNVRDKTILIDIPKFPDYFVEKENGSGHELKTHHLRCDLDIIQILENYSSEQHEAFLCKAGTAPCVIFFSPNSYNAREITFYAVESDNRLQPWFIILDINKIE